jgi:hypothetical protein
MSKVTGLNWTTLSVGDATNTAEAIKNDFTNMTFSTPRAVLDVTGVDKLAFERLLGLADFTFTGTGVFNPAASPSAHDVLHTVPSTSVARTTTLTTNGKTLAGNLLFTDYAITRAVGGMLTFSAPGVLADGAVPTWA